MTIVFKEGGAGFNCGMKFGPGCKMPRTLDFYWIRPGDRVFLTKRFDKEGIWRTPEPTLFSIFERAFVR
jgi:hypothetical protein